MVTTTALVLLETPARRSNSLEQPAVEIVPKSLEKALKREHRQYVSLQTSLFLFLFVVCTLKSWIFYNS